MKNQIKTVSLVALYVFALLSCDNDPLNEERNNSQKISVQFETAAKEIIENAVEETLTIKFSQPALTDAILTLKAGNDFSEALSTNPVVEEGFIKIQILEGDVAAQIKLSPINNNIKDGHRVVNLSLTGLPFQFITGANNSINITIKDDETTGPHVESAANFVDQDVVLDESNSTGIEYQIHLSKSVAIDSEIKITLSSDNGVYDLHYTTQPVAENNVLTLPVSAGLNVIGFKVIPVANTQITGELKIKLTISQTAGSITKGNNLDQTITIKDDELSQKPKGYEVTAGNTVLKKFYEYDEFGRVSKVKWENYTPYLLQGTDTYFYDANSLLVKINKYAGKDILYHWSNGRIVKLEEVVNGIIRSYSELDYDDHGNITGAVSYHLQSNGNFAKGFYTIYLYFMDGNLYKSLTYQDTEDPENPYLVSTKTYDNYIDVSNPFPMTEVVPVVKSQTKLATTYRVEENESDLTYSLVYEYRPDGLPAKRIATANGDTQTAVYHYY